MKPIFLKLNLIQQMNFAKIEREMIAYYLKGLKMIKLSNGIEISEETVVNALKKAGISVEPKHIFRAGDVATQGTGTSWRFIVDVGGKLRSVGSGGYVGCGTDQDYFERNDYRFVGRQSDLIRG